MLKNIIQTWLKRHIADVLRVVVHTFKEFVINVYLWRFDPQSCGRALDLQQTLLDYTHFGPKIHSVLPHMFIISLRALIVRHVTTDQPNILPFPIWSICLRLRAEAIKLLAINYPSVRITHVWERRGSLRGTISHSKQKTEYPTCSVYVYQMTSWQSSIRSNISNTCHLHTEFR